MIAKYAFIRDEKIIKFKNVPADDKLLIKKLLAHNYLIVVEQSPPKFDGATQSLSDRYEINKDKVIRIWEVTEKPFDEAKKAKEDILKLETLDHIDESLESPSQASLVADILSDRNQKATAIKSAKTNKDLREIKGK